MVRRWCSRFVAVGLLAVTVCATSLEGATSVAQEPSGVPEVASAFAADLSPLGLPEDADLATDALRRIADTPPVLSAPDLDAIAGRAAAIVRATDGAAWNLGPLSERLEYAPQAAFEFVRDSIGYDPYPGVLRGARGTLLARSGNDIDRALLLRDLLDRMVVPSRLVVGSLDRQEASALIERSFLPPSRPLTAAPLDPQEFGDLAALEARARRDYAIVRGAIGDRVARMDGSATTEAITETQQHVWVQMRFGTEWLDLDPSLPDSQPGQTLTTVGKVLYDVPDAWRDSVTIRVIAERLSGGQLSEQTVLERQLDAATAARQDIFLAMSPVGDSIGQTINEILGSGSGWRPTLFVGGEEFAGDTFPVTPEQDIFSGDQSGDEFSALRLEVTVSVPGSEPETILRTLVDRLTPEARAASSIDRTDLAPLTVRKGVPVELSSVLHFQVSTGAFDVRTHQIWRQIAAVFSKLLGQDPAAAAEYGFPNVMLPMTVADESLVQASERLISDGLDRTPGIRAFVARPRVYLTSVGPTAEEGRVSTGSDLMTDTVRVLAADGQDGVAAARRQLWYGALQGALESQFLLSRITAGGLSGGQLSGVSFGSPDRATLLAADGQPAPIGTSAVLRQDVADGALAVVPGDAATAAAWWRVDPVSGATKAILAPGTGGGAYTDAVTNTAGRIFANPNSVPQTQAELNQLYRQALAQVEGAGRPIPRATCFGGHEYGSLLCNILAVAPYVFLLGVVVALIAWII